MSETLLNRRRRRWRLDARAVGLVLTVAAILIAALGALIAPFDPFDTVNTALLAPSADHLLGTDDLGRDLLSRLVAGLRVSLVVGLVVALSSMVIGGFVGLVAGSLGGRADDLLMRFAELIQILPRFFLALLVVALFGSSLVNLIVVLALTSWAVTARIMRSRVLVVKELEFVEASRAIGAGDLRIMVRSIAPNALAPIVSLVGLQFGGAILVEAGLSFLGLGDPNVVSLGQMLSRAQPFMRTAWWMAIFPGLALAMTILGVNLLADSLNRFLDPRSIGPR
ncbi:MAG: ABC transporter permease [Acidimicrobiia bacterium]|nr:ABC transporter permease [Acidimicrobiia bacterium]